MSARHPDGTHDGLLLEARASFSKLREAAVALGATPWHLLVWLGVFTSIWAALRSPPQVRVLEIVRSPPAPTRALLHLIVFARSPWGTRSAAAIVVASLAGFALFRARPASRRCFLALATLGAAFFPAAFVAIAAGLL